MKKIIKSLMIFTVMTVLFTVLAMTASAETYTGECGLEGDNLIWSFDTETGVLTIDGEGEMDNYSLYNNINKTSAPWWDYYSQIKDLVLGDGVTSIGEYAFYNCDTLTELVIPGNVRIIGNCAFYDCDRITDLCLEEGLNSINENVFYKCDGIKTVILPDSLTFIGKYAFYECKSLENVKLGNGLSELSTGTFSNCDNLRNIEWGSNLKTISVIAFAYNRVYNYGDIVIPKGVEKICNQAFCVYGSSTMSTTNSVSIPITVKEIESTVFGSDTVIMDVYYEGTIEQWEQINIASSNSALRNAERFHFGHAHSYISEITTAPTCLDKGIKTYICECGETYTRELSALGHDIITDEAVEATCTETGLTEGEHCLRCDYKVAQKETPSLGHDKRVIPAVDATCTQTGLTEGLGCSRCDVIFTEQKVTPIIDHNIIALPAVAPNCTETGLTAGEGCSECSYRVAQEVVPALGHTEIIDKAVAPTCTETGLTEGKHCNVCGEPTVTQEVIPALGHKEVFTSYVEPTCTEDGLSVGKVCEICAEVFIPAQVIPAKGHKLSDWIVTSKLSCTTDGIKIRICTCGLTEEEIIPAIGHADEDADGKCDNCYVSLTVNPVRPDEEPEKKANVFSFLTSFLNTLIDFLKKMFGI